MTVALVALAAIVAGCGGSSGKGSASAAPGTRNVTATAPAASAAVTISVKSDEEHAKKGPEGTWHDAFLPADFTVAAGQRVTVTVYNYDTSAHTFNAPEMGVNETIPAGSASRPHQVVFSFTAPSKPGSYQWFCAMPCDPWAMAHDGFMRGHVTVTT